MRKLSLVLVAAILLSTGNLLANNVDNVKPTKTLTTQISKLLSVNTLTEKEVNAIAQVRFTINSEKEIVVLSVVSENDRLESFVKGNLNYKKVVIKNYVEGKVYTVPVRIQS